MSDFEIIVRITERSVSFFSDIVLYRRKALLDELADEGWTEKELEKLDHDLDAVPDIVIRTAQGSSSLHRRAFSATPKRAGLSTGKGKKKPLSTGK